MRLCQTDAWHEGYVFAEVAKRTAAFVRERPGPLYRLGVGDVTRPLSAPVVRALREAGAEMGRAETFRGYAPTAGYPFLIERILESEYAPLGVALEPCEVFVSDGAKSDAGNLLELFAPDAVVAVCDPSYPVYAHAARLSGRRVAAMPCGPENGFEPSPPETRADLIYLCSPNNPTGTALSRDCLRAFVRYARCADALLVFDAAYRAFCRDGDAPRSVYEIEGARACAAELGSLSKSAGFTGLRCAWMALPRQTGLTARWAARCAARFNGVAYPVQRAAEAALGPEGRAASGADVAAYREQAAMLRRAVRGLLAFGGEDAPYLWVRCPGGLSGWAWFERLLREDRVVITPGEGFGPGGAGWARLSALGARDETEEACARLAARGRAEGWA